MILNKISDNFVFKILKYINHGHLKLTNFNKDVFYLNDYDPGCVDTSISDGITLLFE